MVTKSSKANNEFGRQSTLFFSAMESCPHLHKGHLHTTVKQLSAARKRFVSGWREINQSIISALCTANQLDVPDYSHQNTSI
jgi:hypothetical protein